MKNQKKSMLRELFKKDYGNAANNKSYDNYNERKRLMKFNRFFAQYKVFTIFYSIGTFIAITIIMIVLNRLQSMSLKHIFSTGELTYNNKSLLSTISDFFPFFIILILAALVFYAKFAYNARVSFGDINVGQKGTDRWSTDEEIKEQYVEIADTEESFPGMGGIPIARRGNKTYHIDDTNTNNLIIGTTRSGKGELELLPMIDNLSRAEKKCSMVITDPKIDIPARAIPKLEQRGYRCYVLNLVDPEFSMGYNPLSTIVDEYKSRNIDTAQQLCSSLAYNIFVVQEGEKDPYFTDSARNVFTAMVMAEIEDNLKADKELNQRYLHDHNAEEDEREEKYFRELYQDQYADYLIKKETDRLREQEPTISLQGIIEELNLIASVDLPQALPAEILSMLSTDKLKELETFKYLSHTFQRRKYYPTQENENKITIYSIIKICNVLSSTKLPRGRTALDEYFESRDEDNFARITYSALVEASENTKGTVMSVFRSKLAIFGFESIAKMTSSSSIDFTDIGFGNQPVAIFIGLPDYDSSNHFLATVFINQVYFTLAKLATAMPGGQLHRRVHFIFDAFGNLPALDNMSNIPTVCLGRNILFTFVVQSKSQIDDKYQDGAKTIIGNCGNHIYIMSADMDTAKWFSDALGTETITTINRTGKKLSLNKEITEMSEEKPLLTATELMNLKMGETVVIRYMFRESRTGTRERVKALSIVNMGQNQMKYAYEFLLETFPQGQILYESPNMDRIVQSNPDLANMPLKLANVQLEKTNHIVLKERSRSAVAWLNYMKWRFDAFPAKIGLPMEDMKRMDQVFTLMNLTQEERTLYMEAGQYDDEAEEYYQEEMVLLNGQIEDYAKKLLTYRSKEITEKGYSLLDILLPLPPKKRTKEEIADESEWEHQLLSQVNYTDERM